MEPPAWLEREKYNLTSDERNSVLQFLLKNLKDSVNSKLKFGAISQGAKNFKCNRKTVVTIWCQACACGDNSPMKVENKRKESAEEKRWIELKI